MLNDEEKKFFRDENESLLKQHSAEIAMSDVLVKLTCAAINGVCKTSYEGSPESFGRIAARVARAAMLELMNPQPLD